MRVLTTNRKYAKAYLDISKHILKYSRDSAFSIAMKYLAMEDTQDQGPLKIQNAPWLIFLLIKISSASTGALKMNETDFVRICNKLFRLQDSLIAPNEPNILLKFRPLIYQQLLLQNNVHECMMSLARQCKILGGNQFYEEHFFNITRVGVASYFTLWLNIFAQASNKQGDDVLELNVPELIYRVQKTVSMHELVNFFVFFGIRYEDLSAFFEDFSGSSESPDGYYYDTPLKKKPFLLVNNKIYLFSTRLLYSCFPLLLIKTIKDAKTQNAKAQLGLDIEAYVGDLLRKTGLPVTTEDQLQKIFSKHGIARLGRGVTDFSIDAKSIVLVESKAIEQADWLKVNTDPSELKKRLDQDFIKGVMQAELCATQLLKIEDYSERSFKAIIVTYDDFGISTAASLKQLIGIDLEDEIRKKCGGSCPIPLASIVYIPISDLEALALAIKRKLISFEEVIDECFSDHSFNAGMSLRKAIVNKCGLEVYHRAENTLTADDAFIQQLGKLSRSGRALNVQTGIELLTLHAEVMYAIQYWSEQQVANATSTTAPS